MRNKSFHIIYYKVKKNHKVSNTREREREKNFVVIEISVSKFLKNENGMQKIYPIKKSLPSYFPIVYVNRISWVFLLPAAAADSLTSLSFQQ